LAFFLLPIIDYNSKKLLVDKKKSNKIPTKKNFKLPIQWYWQGWDTTK
jgi:hypothetical protein